MNEDLSGYWIVLLRRPLPGVRHEVFVFLTEGEAHEFASCIHAAHEDADTLTQPAGTPESVFGSWSF